jgi:hypothetical protein
VLIQAVDAAPIRLVKDAGHAVRGNTAGGQVDRVARACGHIGNDREAGVHLAGSKMAGASGAGLPIGPRAAFALIVTPGSSTIRSNAARVSSMVSPGAMRQLTSAVARCGRAFCACPPSINVATQVVRSVELNMGSRERTVSASLFCGFSAIADMAWDNDCGIVDSLAVSLKKTVVVWFK